MTKKADMVSWFEIPADDTARASAFYNEVFGWETSDMGYGSLYAQTVPSDENMTPRVVGGINGDISPRTELFDKPLICITVEDLDAKIEMVTQAGGTVVKPREDIEGMMAWAIISDSEGNKVGIVQNF